MVDRTGSTLILDFKNELSDYQTVVSGVAKYNKSVVYLFLPLSFQPLVTSTIIHRQFENLHIYISSLYTFAFYFLCHFSVCVPLKST